MPAASASFAARQLRLAEALGVVATTPLLHPPLRGEGGRRSRPGGAGCRAPRTSPPGSSLRFAPLRAALPLQGRAKICDRPGEIRAGRRRHPFAELLAQHSRRHFRDFARGKLAELERSERHPDQPVHRQPEMAEHGIGVMKRNLLPGVKDPVAYDLMRSLKRMLDPMGILNPGKVL